MGFGIKELLVVLVIVLLLFGTKKLKNLGSDLGSAIKGFKNSMADDGDKPIEPLEKTESEEPKNTSNTSTNNTGSSDK